LAKASEKPSQAAPSALSVLRFDPILNSHDGVDAGINEFGEPFGDVALVTYDGKVLRPRKAQCGIQYDPNPAAATSATSAANSSPLSSEPAAPLKIPMSMSDLPSVVAPV
jgi:hypothetical protein